MNKESTLTNERDLPICTGDNIRKLRIEQKLSYQDLAGLVGVHPSYLCKIEHGERRRVSHTILKNLASTLNVNINDLLEEEITTSISSVTEQKHEIFQQMKFIVSESSLTHRQKVEQLRAIADVCQYLLVNRF